MSRTRWTIEQAAELCLEQFLELLDGCDDDDVVRPMLAFEALRLAWAPGTDVAPLADGVTAGELRRRLQAARRALADGEKIS